MSLKTILLMSGIAAAGFAPARLYAAKAPASEPTAQPSSTSQPSKILIDTGVQKLVDRLGDPDPASREDAYRKLRQMGKSIVPQLQALGQADDPEIRARVADLIRHGQRRLPPAAPQAKRGIYAQSVSSSLGNDGSRSVDVNENGRKIHIEDRQGKSIRMSVSGVDEAGNDATEKYDAKDADELKQDNPEAFALYEKWGGGVGAPSTLRLRLGGNAIPPRGKFAPDPAPQPKAEPKAEAPKVEPPAEKDPGAAHLEQLRKEIEAGDLPADVQQKLLERLKDVEQRHQALRERLGQFDGNKPDRAPAPTTRPVRPRKPATQPEDPDVEQV